MRNRLKVKVNRNQSTFNTGWELNQAMQTGDFSDDQISEVNQALYADDDSALEAVIDRYAE